MSRQREGIIKAFRKARIEGEQMLEAGRISWADFSFVMLGFEEQLKAAGVDL